MKRMIISSEDNLAERIEDELYALMDSNDGESDVRGITTRKYYTLRQENMGYVLMDGNAKHDFDYLSQVANWLIGH